MLYKLTEGDYFVRGTQDLDVVKAMIEESEDFLDELFDLDYDWEAQLNVSRAGYFRFNPCNCGEHGWHLGYASGPGRGRFEGVQFDPEAVEIVFEMDVEHDLAALGA